MTAKIRYDYEFLQQFCKENGIELTKIKILNKKDDEIEINHANCKLYSTTYIAGECSTHNCRGNFCRFFKELFKYGGKCERCIRTNKYNLITLNSLNLKLSREYLNDELHAHFKINGECLNTECNNTFSRKFCDLLNIGGYCELCAVKNGNNKKICTFKKKYGVENISQLESVKKQKEETHNNNFGVKYPMQSQEKTKKTNLNKFGVEYPLQNAEVSEKSSKNAYKAYDYIFPSGRVERIQGYERFMLNDLLQKEGILEDDIVVSRSEVPSVWYEDETGKQRRYFVDCFIKSQNRCIEAKSTWTAAKKNDCIYLKQQALKDAGYKCEIWIYDGKGELVDKVI